MENSIVPPPHSSAVADPEILKGRGAEDNVSARRHFWQMRIINYVPSILGKGGLLTKILSFSRI